MAEQFIAGAYEIRQYSITPGHLTEISEESKAALRRAHVIVFEMQWLQFARVYQVVCVDEVSFYSFIVVYYALVVPIDGHCNRKTESFTHLLSSTIESAHWKFNKPIFDFITIFFFTRNKTSKSDWNRIAISNSLHLVCVYCPNEPQRKCEFQRKKN